MTRWNRKSPLTWVVTIVGIVALSALADWNTTVWVIVLIALVLFALGRLGYRRLSTH